MGSGKSSVGRELASLTGLLFIDLDEYIEHKTGQSIPGIIADGEDRFRAIEAEAFRDIFIMREIRNESAVVALGGGTVETEAVWHLIFGHTTCVYLKASFESCEARTGADTGQRPLFSRDLYEKRLPLYEKAQFSVETDGRTTEEIAAEIREKLENFR